MTTVDLEEIRQSNVGRAPAGQNTGDRLFFRFVQGVALLTPALLVLFVAVLVYGAWPSIRAFGASFLISSAWEPNPAREQYGAAPFILGTLVSSILALCIAAPVGVAAAAFIGEVMPARLRGPARFLIETLATVPSVVYGLWGIYVLAPWVKDAVRPALAGPLGFLPVFGPPYEPRNMLCAVLILSIMVLPIIVSVSLDAIRSVDSTYRQAALGLGATRWEMARIAVWPAARPAIVGACILALGRALGETMAVTMVIGNGRRFGASLFASSDTIASTIANQFAESPSDLFTAALIEMALVLFVTTIVVNVVARLLVRRPAAAGGGGH